MLIWREAVTTRKAAAIAIALQLIASPVLAQGAATKDNAHTYPGLTEDRGAPYNEEGEEICNDGPEWTQ